MRSVQVLDIGRFAVAMAALCLLLAMLPGIAAIGEPWGCCIPDAGTCFDGGAYQTRDTFRDACTAANGELIGEDVASTCSAYEQCDLGCCCAGQDVFGSPAINSDESLLRSTRAACSVKTGGTWTFSVPQGGSTCVQACGGDAGNPGGAVHTVSGRILNATSGAGLADVGVFIPVPAGDISDTTGADGAFILADVPEMSTRVFAVHPSCRPSQSQVLLVDHDLSGITVSLDCAMQACQHQTPSVTQAQVTRGTNEAQFTAAIQDTCRDLVQFEPQRCDAQHATCIALPPQESPAMRDTDLLPSTTYCYRVLARFADGTSTTSADTCVTTGDIACMGREPGDPPRWCGVAGDSAASAILSCDEQNRLRSEGCTGTTVCSMASGTPRCVEPPACSLCNGLAGLFSNLDLDIIDGLFTRACADACVLDRQVAGNPLVVDAYSACFAFGSCSQYRNQAACERDLCAIGSDESPCAWTQVSAELGLGVCAGASTPACSRCDDLFGVCSKELCSSISPDCYYDGEGNGLAQPLGCLPRSAMSCRRYDSQQDCTGGVDAAFDIQRDAAGAYVGGTNDHVVESHDALSLGACVWSANRCIKDADERTQRGEDDCIENGRFYDDTSCLSDSTPANTSFYLSDPPIYTRAAVRTLPFTVRDDRSPIDAIRTYVCIGSASCVPKDTLGTIALPAEGRYTLRFFSVDASENYEPVKSREIIIKDLHEPAIEDVALEEDR